MSLSDQVLHHPYTTKCFAAAEQQADAILCMSGLTLKDEDQEQVRILLLLAYIRGRNDQLMEDYGDLMRSR